MHLYVCLCFSDIAGKGIKQTQGQGNCLKVCRSVWRMRGLKPICNYFIILSFFKTLIPMFPFCCLSTFKFPCFTCRPIYKHTLKLCCRNEALGCINDSRRTTCYHPRSANLMWVQMASLSVCVRCINPATRRVGVVRIVTETCHGSGSNISQGAFIEETTTVCFCTKCQMA